MYSEAVAVLGGICKEPKNFDLLPTSQNFVWAQGKMLLLMDRKKKDKQQQRQLQQQ